MNALGLQLIINGSIMQGVAITMKTEKSAQEQSKNQAGGGEPPSNSSGVLEAFTQHKGSLRHFLSRFMITPHEIDDVSQEAFLRAYQAEQKKQIEQPKAFLFRIAKNLVLSEFNRKSRKVTDYIEDFEQNEILDQDSLEDNIMAQQKLGIYCEAVAALPEQCRRAVLMKKVYGMSNKEIAARMKIAVSTVEKHLAKGVRQCSRFISERYEECPDVPSSTDSARKAGRKA